jgi:hypothetical protein
VQLVRGLRLRGRRPAARRALPQRRCRAHALARAPDTDGRRATRTTAASSSSPSRTSASSSAISATATSRPSRGTPARPARSVTRVAAGTASTSSVGTSRSCARTSACLGEPPRSGAQPLSAKERSPRRPSSSASARTGSDVEGLLLLARLVARRRAVEAVWQGQPEGSAARCRPRPEALART